MRGVSPESPEQRRRLSASPNASSRAASPALRTTDVARRVAIGVYNDGFIHAGNLAYLSLLTLFPFFIVTAAILQLVGRTGDKQAVIEGFLATLPTGVAAMIEAPALHAQTARTGPLLWFGAIVGLWTVTSFIETIRDILRRAYGTAYQRPFWQYRLIGIAIVFASVALMMVGFTAQVIFATAEAVIARYVPAADVYAAWIRGTRFLPLLAIYCAIFMMFWTLAPTDYRGRRYPKWPGALFTTLWWYGTLTLLPAVVASFDGYALTYGGLAGVIVTLLFFWLVGYGVVIGAHLNAALANPAHSSVRAPSAFDDLTEAKWLDT